jgi:hypothetical protein
LLPLQSKNSINNAKLGVQNIRLALDQTKLALYEEIQQAHADALAALENIFRAGSGRSNQAAPNTAAKTEVGLMNSVHFNVTKQPGDASPLLYGQIHHIFRLKDSRPIWEPNRTVNGSDPI